MRQVAVECFCCGRGLDVAKTYEVESWQDDCLFVTELVCHKCDVRVMIEGTVTITRGDEVFILRPIRHGARAG